MQKVTPIIFHVNERKEFVPKTWLQKALNWALTKLDTPKAIQCEEVNIDLVNLENELFRQINFTLSTVRQRPKYILVGTDVMSLVAQKRLDGEYFQFQYPGGYYFQGIRVIYIPNMLGVIAIPDPETI